MGITTALIASAAIGAGTSYYQASEQEKALKEQERELARQEEERQAELERIARDTRPEGETVGSIQFGADTSTAYTGGLNDFLIPLDTSSSQLNSSTTGSLGFIL